MSRIIRLGGVYKTRGLAKSQAAILRSYGIGAVSYAESVAGGVVIRVVYCIFKNAKGRRFAAAFYPSSCCIKSLQAMTVPRLDGAEN
jgi:hypothetical protein